MTSVAVAPCYVFGIVPAEALDAHSDAWKPPDDRAGITAVRSVVADPLAAVIGSPPADRPLGRAADLRTHDRVLTALVSAGIAVLPFRFGAVLATEDDVIDDLLAPHRERFVRALDLVRGRVQYTVQVRYEQDAVLRELLAEDPEIARLRQDPGSADVLGQIRLGRLVVSALERRRPAAAAAMIDALQGVSVDLRILPPSAPDDVLRAAALVDDHGRERFEQAVEDGARRGAGRLRVRLVGPLAPYDFAGEG